MVVRAILEKLITDDGIIAFADHARLGQEYLVHLDSIRRGQTLVHYHEGNGDEPVLHTKDIIFTVDGSWLPLECLRLVV